MIRWLLSRSLCERSGAVSNGHQTHSHGNERRRRRRLLGTHTHNYNDYTATATALQWSSGDERPCFRWRSGRQRHPGYRVGPHPVSQLTTSFLTRCRRRQMDGAL
ncbi:hypothetical protein LDENG_00097540 [Lucifuga dentata]|nr:hypothetical protein LDENG_00097540 [Lucifuga dentata]